MTFTHCLLTPRYLISSCQGACGSKTLQFINCSTRPPHRPFDPLGSTVPSKIIQIKNKTIQGLLRIMHSSGTMKLRVPISCPSCLLSKRHLVCADNTMNPFHKTVTTRLTVISIVNTQKFVIFIFFKKKNICTFITLFFVLYYLCIKLQKSVLR